MLRQQNNQKNVINGSTLPIDCQQMFRACGCPATKISQLVSGVKLAKAVNTVLFDGKNQILSNQIITQNEERKGNNVINFNMILKQLKINSKVAFPQHLIALSPFKLMDAQQEMTKLIKWLAQCWDQQNNRFQPKYKQNDALLMQQQQGKQNFERNTPHLEKNQTESFIIRNKKTPNNKTALQQQRPDDQEEFQGKEMSPSDYGDHQKEQNLFQNVFFLDRDLSPKEEPHLNDSLQMSEKVSKKGSFKIIRPKTTFENQNAGKIEREESPQKFNGFQDQNKIKAEGNQKYFSEEKQESRKTIPKMAERPPLYKRLDKSRQQIATQNQNRSRGLSDRFKEPAAFETQNGSSQKKIKIESGMSNKNGITQANHNSRNENLSKQINELERQIRKQSSVNLSLAKNSEQLGQKNGLANSRNREKGQRKLFKIDIKEVDEGQRRNIIEWLININLLNSNATIYYDRFHQICKNGVIFPEIINHHIGRSGQLAYFKNPIKSAQLHSNYQKVFTYLKQLPNFESELLFMYDYFVPEAFQNAFWSLLNSCYSCFSKGSRKRSKTFSRDSQVRQKINLQSSFENNRDIKQNSHQSLKKAIEQSNSQQYQKIKYGRTQSLKKAIKKTESRTETQKIDSLSKQSRSKRKGSLDFIRDLPDSNYSLKHEELVQIQEPVEQKKQAKGYKDLHQLKKSHNTSSFINTPKKKNENSASRSRIVSTSSAKKLSEKVELPSISLQMEMKSLGYLKQKGLINFATLDPLPLFEDPIRNGCLINKIICNELKLNYKYNLKPRNIIDCKDNFLKGFSQLKESFILIPHSYQVHFQNIIKGEMSLFYGIIWHIISSTTNKGEVCLKDLKNESAILSISKNYNFDHQINQKMEEEVLFWVRQLQQQSQFIAELNIRNFANLSNSICCQNLLYKIAMAIMPEKYTLKPTYQHPTNNLQQQSNIKKILSYFAHNKILRSELAWKAKSLVKKQKATTIQIMKNLMNYVKNTKKPAMPVQTQNPVVSFVKFARQFSKEESKINQRNNERLETTMANNSFAAPALKKQPVKSIEKKKQVQPIQVPWMRSLGFTGDLSLNNGVVLCRLISKLTMKTLNYNENPSSKAECLTNIRKALKLIDKFKWDQEDIANSDEKLTAEIFKFLKQKYKHSYALKQIC